MSKATGWMGAAGALAGYGLGGLVWWALPMLLSSLLVLALCAAWHAMDDAAHKVRCKRAALARRYAARLAADRLERDRVAMVRTVCLA